MSLIIFLFLLGYQFCGPGTKLAKRLARGDRGINPLDASCREHDIAYSQSADDLNARHLADKVLQERAWERVKSSDATLGEKAAALTVTNLMKAKRKLGMGVRRRRRRCGKVGQGIRRQRKVGRGKRRVGRKRQVNKKTITPTTVLRNVVNAAKHSMSPSTRARDVIASALKGARAAVRAAGGQRFIRKPRVLPVPSRVGGILPAFLIPLFAALSAAGSLAGGGAAIAKAVNTSKAAQRAIAEQRRHNAVMESKSGSGITDTYPIGRGLHLAPYRKGMGLFLHPYSKTKN